MHLAPLTLSGKEVLSLAHNTLDTILYKTERKLIVLSSVILRGFVFSVIALTEWNSIRGEMHQSQKCFSPPLWPDRQQQTSRSGKIPHSCQSAPGAEPPLMLKAARQISSDETVFINSLFIASVTLGSKPSSNEVGFEGFDVVNSLWKYLTAIYPFEPSLKYCDYFLI